jgi:hypothetical protein
VIAIYAIQTHSLLRSGCDPDDALEVDGIYQQQPSVDDDDPMSEA